MKNLVLNPGSVFKLAADWKMLGAGTELELIEMPGHVSNTGMEISLIFRITCGDAGAHALLTLTPEQFMTMEIE